MKKNKLIKTPIRYAGGKSKAINLITPFIMDYDEIVSPFMGGGSLEVHWSANLGKKVYGYDVFDMLVNWWNVLLNQPKELSTLLKTIEPTPDNYKIIKEKLMTTTNTQTMLKDWGTSHYKRNDVITLDEVTLAAYYYFNHNCSYGPGYLGWGSSVYLNDKSWKNTTEKINNFSNENLSVELSSFEDTIKNNPDKFLYLDPPYYLERDLDNKMHKGIYPMKNIDVHHTGFSHETLRDLLLEHDGDFVMSYNNCETIREWYKDFEFFYPEWSYSLGNGETRIGKNRKKYNDGEIVKESHEILIVKRGK
jgi:DNA adenine methylase